jgi:hypothetical protein
LQAGSENDPPVQFELDARLQPVAMSDSDPLDGPPRPRQINPVEDSFEVALAMGSCVNCASYGAADSHQVVESGHAGACRSATHLCQVGTTPGYGTVEVEIPETEGPTEIDHRYPKAAIHRYEPTPGTENQPPLAVGREHVDRPLKPVSTATTDEEIGQATDAERRPSPQVDALVNLGFTVFLCGSEVLLEIRRSVEHV